MTGQMPEPQKRLFQNVLYFTGMILILAGVFGLSSPHSYAFIFEDDTFIAQVFSAALIVAGLGDLFIAKIFFKTEDRK